MASSVMRLHSWQNTVHRKKQPPLLMDCNASAADTKLARKTTLSLSLPLYNAELALQATPLR